MALTVVDHPLAGTMLTALRDEATPPPLFRLLTKRLSLVLAVEATREIPVQVNGKLRDRVIVAADAAVAEIEAAVLASPKIVAILAGRTPDRVVVAGGGRLVNIVIR